MVIKFEYPSYCDCLRVRLYILLSDKIYKYNSKLANYFFKKATEIIKNKITEHKKEMKENLW